MKLILTPVIGYPQYEVSREGDTLTIDGATVALEGLQEGGTLPHGTIQCDQINGDVSRVDGVLVVPLILPRQFIGAPTPPAARAVTHPDLITLEENGPVAFPSYNEGAVQ